MESRMKSCRKYWYLVIWCLYCEPRKIQPCPVICFFSVGRASQAKPCCLENQPHSWRNPLNYAPATIDSTSWAMIATRVCSGEPRSYKLLHQLRKPLEISSRPLMVVAWLLFFGLGLEPLKVNSSGQWYSRRNKSLQTTTRASCF